MKSYNCTKNCTDRRNGVCPTEEECAGCVRECKGCDDFQTPKSPAYASHDGTCAICGGHGFVGNGGEGYSPKGSCFLSAMKHCMMMFERGTPYSHVMSTGGGSAWGDR